MYYILVSKGNSLSEGSLIFFHKDKKITTLNVLSTFFVFQPSLYRPVTHDASDG